MSATVVAALVTASVAPAAGPAPRVVVEAAGLAATGVEDMARCRLSRFGE
ncbi:hypothetical protein ACFUN8_03980 [Streptomyces sp. NPDC057307]